MSPSGTTRAGTYEGQPVLPEESGYIVAEEGTRWRVAWRNALILPALHVAALYGLYLAITQAQLKTWIFSVSYGMTSGLGITAGAHRLWAHRAYKAKWPLRVILIILNCIVFEGAIYNWVRDHRIHHRYSETNADPHNATRGFFYSHVGWLMLKKHPDVTANAHSVDMSDLLQDPLIVFQRKYYLLLVLVFSFIIPTYAATLLGETLWISFMSSGIFRYVFVLNITWLVNSAAHIFGNRPYDKHINPAENRFVSMVALGEGFHNYHHTFPWDYKAAELGAYSLNFTTAFIDFMAKIGWAYDLKTVPSQVITDRRIRTGEGSDDVRGLENKKST